MARLTMEFESENEARDYALEHQLDLTSYDDDSMVATFGEECCEKSNPTPIRNARIFAYYNGNKMYLAKKGTTFVRQSAQIFKLSVATTKVENMNKNQSRRYDWKYEEVK